MAVLAVFGGMALFTVVLTVVAMRVRRSGDADNLAVRAAQVATQCKDLLVGDDFLRAVWQDTSNAAAMKVLVRNARDEVVSTITVPSVPHEGLLRRFELGGKRYEIRKVSLMSYRTCLRESGRDAVLHSADHAMARIAFYQGDGEKETVVMPITTVLKRYRPLEVGGQAIGKLITGLEGTAFASVITLPAGRSPLPEQVFVLASR